MRICLSPEADMRASLAWLPRMLVTLNPKFRNIFKISRPDNLFNLGIVCEREGFVAQHEAGSGRQTAAFELLVVEIHFQSASQVRQ